MKQKKGFTLIELMVVIVIIGILAAIAIPKLFGMTAKAKASEVGPAGGTWSKLQQAYFMEKTQYGSWQSIAYRAPNSTLAGATNTIGIFRYNGSLLTGTTDADNASWWATNTAKLGDCDGGTWVAVYANTTTDSPTTSVTNALCEGLTPNFKELK